MKYNWFDWKKERVIKEIASSVPDGDGHYVPRPFKRPSHPELMQKGSPVQGVVGHDAKSPNHLHKAASLCKGVIDSIKSLPPQTQEKLSRYNPILTKLLQKLTYGKQLIPSVKGDPVKLVSDLVNVLDAFSDKFYGFCEELEGLIYDLDVELNGRTMPPEDPDYKPREKPHQENPDDDGFKDNDDPYNLFGGNW